MQNTYQRTIKLKPTDIKVDIYTGFDVEKNDKDPKFKTVDHIKISKYKTIFTRGYTPNWTKKGFCG